jgi:hypothetical protein
MQSKLIDIDSYFDDIGHIGKYQIVVCILIGLPMIIVSTSACQQIFTDATPNYRY